MTLSNFQLPEFSLADYEISRERGFLASYNPADVKLPDELREVREVAMSMPQLIPTGRVRSNIESMSLVDLSEFCQTASQEQLRVAMVHYTFMIQVFIWGEETITDRLPVSIAQPAWQLSQATGQPPLLTYSNYVLDNWDRVDREQTIDLSNIYMIQPFAGGQDEAWFVLIHVAIEAAAGKVLAEFPELIIAAKHSDNTAMQSGLEKMADAWNQVNAVFDRMPERCDPYVYFHRVRPWIHGWKDNPALPDGVIYEGVDAFKGRPQAYRGQTGSQSSIVPSMDALLGIGHSADPLRKFLDELHNYRPPAHRRFIEDVHAASELRSAVTNSDSNALKEAYNEVLLLLASFRTKHLEYAASYINKQGKGGAGNTSEVGTGGTPFMKYLKKHRDEVQKNLL